MVKNAILRNLQKRIFPEETMKQALAETLDELKTQNKGQKNPARKPQETFKSEQSEPKKEVAV